MDNTWDYNDGISETRMGKALAERRDCVFLMPECCTHGRDARIAMKQLEDSLRRRVRTTARDGRFELYKISAAFDGNESRRQHGLPLMGELIA